jgi:hypothetical protein
MLHWLRLTPQHSPIIRPSAAALSLSNLLPRRGPKAPKRKFPRSELPSCSQQYIEYFAPVASKASFSQPSFSSLS